MIHLGTNLHILAVVHNTPFIYTLRSFLQRESSRLRLHVTRRTDETILYLRGVGIYSNRMQHPEPDLVLLDSANPDASDLEVLSWLRSSEGYAHLPVIILVEPSSKERLQQALDLGANSFLVKRDSLANLGDMILDIEQARSFHRAAPRAAMHAG